MKCHIQKQLLDDFILIVILLIICTSAYWRAMWPGSIDPYKEGFLGIFRRAAVIGDRLSPWVSASCFFMGFAILLFR